MTAVALALAASLFWGVADFLGGISSRRLATLTVLAVSQVAGLVVIGVFVAARAEGPPGARDLVPAVLAGVAGAVGLGALYRGMAIGPIGVVAPISSAAAVVPVVVGLAAGEEPGALQLCGIALVLAGVVLASREPSSAGRLAAGAMLALVAALGFGSFFVAIDAASDESVVWALLAARATSSAVAVGVALRARSLVADVRDLPVLAVIGLFDMLANALLALALTKGFASIVSVLASLYPVVTILLARLVLRERLARPQRLGIAGALAGVALISAG